VRHAVHVVMISKALVVGAYQRKLEELACQPGIELSVIVPPSWQDRRGAVKLERAFTKGYRLIEAPIVLNGQYHLHFYPSAGRLLRELKPDIVHMDEEPYNLATWLVLRDAQRVGAASLFFTWQNLNRSYPWPFREFERANYHMARWAIAGNEDARRVLREKGYAGQVSVLPQFGVDPGVFFPLRRPQHSTFVIGYAGGLVPEKGVDLLVRACQLLESVPWELRIAGGGPDEGRLRRLVEQLELAGRVHFVGHIPSTEVASFYQGLDVLVLPSISQDNWAEQFGRVLIEAMSCGVPVVGSSSREIPRVIGDGGIVFDEGDVSGLWHALSSLAADPLRCRELGERGHARVLAHFTHQHIAEATAAIYRQMLVQNG
jgi:glycosyltransferase involved in cell wall biosynthesis